MNAEEILNLLVDEFGSERITGSNLAAMDPWIEVAAASIEEVSRFLKTDERLLLDHLNNLCGVDYFEPDEKKAAKFGHDPHVEVVYHLSSYTHRHKITIKVCVPRWKDDQAGQLPEVPTVSGVWKIADWHERETFDLVGVNFSGHPNLTRILCAEDWVGHPLRKDYEFPLEYHGIRGK
ncbi:MAG: NADH-quinone oxidoreductase subunit C [Planctomycetota bacterium]|nr:NADH-quinone oxidoreductase subunit C [Planctomycetota bacterium]MDA1161901.1 NADH-quinone oxidoreductase subunit C [Planctomycetota bacterium]